MFDPVTAVTSNVISYSDFLARHRGAKVFFERLPLGNNGDLLLERGSRHVHSQMGLLYVDSPRSADLIIIRGSSSMLEFDRSLLEMVLEYARSYPDIPICVEPSFYYYPSTQLGELFPRRDIPVYLFARDESSLRYLLRQRRDWLEVGLDHDMSLALLDTDFIQALKGRDDEKVLIVERLDIEHPLRHKASFQLLLKGYTWIVPRFLRKWMNPRLSRLQSKGPSPVKKLAEEILATDLYRFRLLPRVYEDVSDVGLNDFEQFVDKIAASSAVITTRLHVGLLSAMLEKPTVFVVGDFPKIRTVYEYSLRGWPNVAIRELL